MVPASLLRHGKALEDILDRYPSDFQAAPPAVPDRMRNQNPDNYFQQFTCPWGSVWEERERGVFGQVVKPALESWEMMEDYRFPDPPFKEPAAFDSERKKILQHKQLRYALGTYDYRYANYMYQGYSFFQRLFFLRGYENLMIDIIEDREELHLLADRVIDYLSKAIGIALDLGVDGIFFADDWGTQESLMINPFDWRKFFKPRYQRLFDQIHARNAHVLFHTDGYTLDIIPDLIEMGVDVINPQFSCMDLELLADVTKGKVCVLTDLDRQHLLPHGTPKEIRAYVEKVIALFGTPKGGLILRGSIFYDVPLANVEAMFAAFADYGTL
jgi:hypothetical protein